MKAIYVILIALVALNLIWLNMRPAKADLFVPLYDRFRVEGTFDGHQVSLTIYEHKN
jgi:hypothetical protein